MLDRVRKICQDETFHLYATKSIKKEIEGLLSSSKLLPDDENDTDSKNNNKELFQNALSFRKKMHYYLGHSQKRW